jgi:hypothetical protein
VQLGANSEQLHLVKTEHLKLAFMVNSLPINALQVTAAVAMRRFAVWLQHPSPSLKAHQRKGPPYDGSMDQGPSPDTARALDLAMTALVRVEAFEPPAYSDREGDVIAAAGIALREIIEALSPQAS